MLPPTTPTPTLTTDALAAMIATVRFHFPDDRLENALMKFDQSGDRRAAADAMNKAWAALRAALPADTGLDLLTAFERAVIGFYLGHADAYFALGMLVGSQPMVLLTDLFKPDG